MVSSNKSNQILKSWRVILASASPRRTELLNLLPIDYEQIAARDDEQILIDVSSPVQAVRNLALQKADAVAQLLLSQDARNLLVIGADTMVLDDQQLLGKPRNMSEARSMLQQLSGREHQVITGVAVVCYEQSKRSVRIGSRMTKVCMEIIPDLEIEEYIAGSEPHDKAGAYAIQGAASRWIRRINGCYFNVVGLPVSLVWKMLLHVHELKSVVNDEDEFRMGNSF